jgi:membrane protein
VAHLADGGAHDLKRSHGGGNLIARRVFMFATFKIPLSWGDLLKRTAKETIDDDCLGLAAQLAYYFFLALFPAVLFVLALASFFPLTNVVDDITRALRPIAPAEVLRFLEEQLRRISNADSGGVLTVGILGAVWSSSAALVAIVGSLNRAYDIEEGRPWWKVRLTAIGLTIALAVLMLVSFALILAGPTVAEFLASSIGFGKVFEWAWKILQWPVSFLLVSTGIGLVYYYAPDADQDWVWITPGAVAATLLWVVISLAFKFYVANFADYNATYGAVGGVIVLMLWFYISGLAILVGAEMNAEIEHASPYGKDPGEKVPGQKKKIGLAAVRAYKDWLAHPAPSGGSPSALPHPAPAWRVKEVTMAITNDDRSLGQMFADLSRETRTLIQQEIQLARTELAEKASRMGRGIAFVVAGGLLAYGGLLAIVAAVVLGLIALGLPGWAAALISGIAIAGAGYVFVHSGLAALRARDLTPRQTIDTLKEDAQWLKSQTR